MVKDNFEEENFVSPEVLILAAKNSLSADCTFCMSLLYLPALLVCQKLTELFCECLVGFI